MKTITVRSMDHTLAEEVKRAAKEEGKSSNQFILDTLKERLGMQKQKRHTTLHHDMDHLFGLWSESEFRRIQRKIESERKMDKEIWE